MQNKGNNRIFFFLYSVTHKNPMMIMSGNLAKAGSFAKPFSYMIRSDPKTLSRDEW